MGLLVAGNNPAALKSSKKIYFTATAGQTTFTVTDGYSVGDVEVYMNGIRIVEGDDFYATNGIDIILNSAAATGDSILVVSYNQFNVANVYTKAESDLKYMVATGGTPMASYLRTPNYGITSSSDSLSASMEASALAGEQGVGIKAFGRSMATYGGDILYTADNRGAGGRHRFGYWNGTSFTTAMQIDSSGRVTKPLQPCFNATNGAVVNTGSQQTIQFTNVLVNVGGGYSNSTYRFTAQVSGRYGFNFMAMSYGAGTNRYGLFKNGALYGNQLYAVNQTYENFSGNWVVDLNANEYVEVVTGISGEASVHPDYRSFSGFLIG